jgi:hypothetical protein
MNVRKWNCESFGRPLLVTSYRHKRRAGDLFGPIRHLSYLVYTMRTQNLNERLLYFEAKLKEAEARCAAREPHPRSFSAGYSTEVYKTWTYTIAVIKAKIATIKGQMRRDTQFY